MLYAINNLRIQKNEKKKKQNIKKAKSTTNLQSKRSSKRNIKNQVFISLYAILWYAMTNENL